MSMKYIIVSFTQTIFLIVESYIIQITARKNISKLLRQLPPSLFPKYRLTVNAAIIEHNRKQRRITFRLEEGSTSSSSEEDIMTTGWYKCCKECRQRYVKKKNKYLKQRMSYGNGINRYDRTIEPRSVEIEEVRTPRTKIMENENATTGALISSQSVENLRSMLPSCEQPEEKHDVSVSKISPIVEIPKPPPFPQHVSISKSLKDDVKVSFSIPPPPPFPTSSVLKTEESSFPKTSSLQSLGKFTLFDLRSVKLKPVKSSITITQTIIPQKDVSTPPLRRITAEDLRSVKLRPTAVEMIPKTPDVFDMVNILRKRYAAFHSPLSSCSSTDDFENSFDSGSDYDHFKEENYRIEFFCT